MELPLRLRNLQIDCPKEVRKVRQKFGENDPVMRTLPKELFISIRLKCVDQQHPIASRPLRVLSLIRRDALANLGEVVARQACLAGSVSRGALEFVEKDLPEVQVRREMM